ncbi:MAG: winged helix-turn-helix domain-containing protein [Pseudomonadota bacterium]
MRYRFGDLEIDANTLTVQRDGASVSMQPRPFSLLEYLVIHRDRVVPKQEIFSRVWHDSPVSDAALTTAVRDVRKALGETTGPNESIVRTYYSRGLRFVAPGNAEQTPHALTPTNTNSAVDLYPRTLAVLPMQDLSIGSDLRNVAAGVTEDVQIMLSKFRDVSVLSRKSADCLSIKSLSIKEIGEQLGARYVLEGSIRRKGEAIRLYLSVFEAQLDLPVWAERFDIPEAKFDEVSDATIAELVSATVATIHQYEVRRAKDKPIEDLDAWECYQLGRSLFYMLGQETQLKASALFERAIDLDPNLADAYAFLSYSLNKRQWTTEKDRRIRVSDSRATPMRLRALKMANRALELDQKIPFGWIANARSNIGLGRTEDALRSVMRALELNPNMGFAHYLHGFTLLLMNKPEDADAALERALETSPQDSYRWIILSVKSMGRILAGKFDEAILLSREAQLDPHATFVCDIGEVVGLTQIGELEQAKAAAERALEKNADFCIARFNNDFAFMDPEAQNVFVEGLKAAGVQ